MPKSHKKDISQYNKEYYEKRKEINPNFKKEEYHRNMKRNRAYARKSWHKRRKKCLNLIGSRCLICGYHRVTFHEIYGKKHPRSFHYILTHLSDFIVLCYYCHRAFHWYLKYKSRLKEIEA